MRRFKFTRAAVLGDTMAEMVAVWASIIKEKGKFSKYFLSICEVPFMLFEHVPRDGVVGAGEQAPRPASLLRLIRAVMEVIIGSK